MRRPISADSAIMNPSSKVIALKGTSGGVSNYHPLKSHTSYKYFNFGLLQVSTCSIFGTLPLQNINSTDIKKKVYRWNVIYTVSTDV